jgi:sulfite reductase (NADPH) flavoprotein alpha-component
VGYSRLAPVTGTVENIINLNDISSDRETYHLELSFSENLAFQPGDALGVILPPQSEGSQPIPRLYSIASSLRLYPQEVHLTVARATHRNADGTLGYGLCSNYLAQLQPGDTLKFYIHRNENFRLPEDDSADVIMVGAGTGIAPFRAFVQERVDRAATGRNMLFFGNPHAHCDFLYQLEWQEYVANDALTIHLAFSRDQQQKIYVQHRLAEQGATIIAALEGGAYFYLCGAKIPMSQEVEHTLLDLLMQHKNLTFDAARAYLDDLAEQGRYCKDVY